MTGWSPDRLAVAYDERLLDWQLGEGHPTDPVRAKLAVKLLTAAGVPLDVEAITATAHDELLEVHSADYVDDVLSGRCGQWSGARPDLGAVAAHMFAGTVQVVRAVEAGRVRVGFAPQGAKHHAMRDHSSGFCVFNDMAWAARHLADAGRRVLYVDLDAHHGDGVEALTRDHPGVTTCSVHDRTIFPGTGRTCRPREGVHNWPLPAGAADAALQDAVSDICRIGDELRPDVLLIAVGADGHETDPLSTLAYSYAGYERAAEALGELARRHGAPVLMGGAGGYQPTTHTPQVWARFVARLDAAVRGLETAAA